MVAHYPDPENKKVTFPPSPYYRFLALLAKEMNSRLSVELGLCGGGGSLHLAMESQQVIGVDVVLEYEANIRWIRRNYPNFKFFHGDSVQAAPWIHGNFGDIDILFIDTTHTYEQTMAEYFAYSPYLSDQVVICLDDLFRPGMDLVWSEMPQTKARFDYLHPSASPTDGGFGVIWK
ncbi:MAG: class I SAM-dependent methyltransferase [Candidatus Hodarchaeales archaeon]